LSPNLPDKYRKSAINIICMRIVSGCFAGRACCVGQRYLFGWLGGGRPPRGQVDKDGVERAGATSVLRTCECCLTRSRAYGLHLCPGIDRGSECGQADRDVLPAPVIRAAIGARGRICQPSAEIQLYFHGLAAIRGKVEGGFGIPEGQDRADDR